MTEETNLEGQGPAAGMEAEGRTSAQPEAPRRTAAAERADVLHELARMKRNSETVAGNDAASPESRDQARAWLRLIDVLEGTIRNGLHEGNAEVARMMAEGGAA